jgi:hypothetical protein
VVCLAGDGAGEALAFAAGEADDDAAAGLAFVSAAEAASGAQMRAAIQALLIRNVLFFIIWFWLRVALDPLELTGERCFSSGGVT